VADHQDQSTAMMTWEKRRDGLWNGFCACGGTVVGVESVGSSQEYHDRTMATLRQGGSFYPPCGPEPKEAESFNNYEQTLADIEKLI